MAAPRTPGREGTLPAQARGSQGRETPHEGSAHIIETARHVGETASQSYAQGRPQRAGWAQALEGHLPSQAAAIRGAGHGEWPAPGTPREEIAGAGRGAS